MCVYVCVCMCVSTCAQARLCVCARARACAHTHYSHVNNFSFYERQQVNVRDRAAGLVKDQTLNLDQVTMQRL